MLKILIKQYKVQLPISIKPSPIPIRQKASPAAGSEGLQGMRIVVTELTTKVTA